MLTTIGKFFQWYWMAPVKGLFWYFYVLNLYNTVTAGFKLPLRDIQKVIKRWFTHKQSIHIWIYDDGSPQETKFKVSFINDTRITTSWMKMGNFSCIQSSPNKKMVSDYQSITTNFNSKYSSPTDIFIFCQFCAKNIRKDINKQLHDDPSKIFKCIACKMYCCSRCTNHRYQEFKHCQYCGDKVDERIEKKLERKKK